MRRFLSFVSTCFALAAIFSVSVHADVKEWRPALPLEFGPGADSAGDGRAPAQPRNARVAQSSGRWDRIRDWLFGRSAPTDEPAAALERLGGSRILLEVDSGALRKSMLTELQDDTRRLLREARIGFVGLAVKDGSVEVLIREGSDLRQALTKLEETSVQLSTALGGTVEVRDVGDRLIRLVPTEPAVNDRARASLQKSIEIVQRRIKELGIDTGSVQQDGPDRILVLLPGVNDPTPLTRLLSSRARLTFRLVDLSVSPREALDGPVPPDSEILYAFKSKEPYLVKKQVMMGGEDLADAAPGFDQRTQEPIVTFRFDDRGARRFALITQENIGRPFAIVLDEEVVSAPVVREPILGGRGQISGSFTVEDARNLAILLQAGTLPARLNIIEQHIIDAKSQTGRK
jgi:preprotein translocase subunit SecD